MLSRGDAAGFTVHPKYKERGRRITTVDTGTPIFHYMDIRTPEGFAAKGSASQSLWQEHGPRSLPSFDEHFRRSYARRFLGRYEGSHPATMGERISAHAYDFDIDSPMVRSVLSRRERKHMVREFLARNVSSAFRVSTRLVPHRRPGTASARVRSLDTGLNRFRFPATHRKPFVHLPSLHIAVRARWAVVAMFFLNGFVVGSWAPQSRRSSNASASTSSRWAC